MGWKDPWMPDPDPWKQIMRDMYTRMYYNDKWMQLTMTLEEYIEMMGPF